MDMASLGNLLLAILNSIELDIGALSTTHACVLLTLKRVRVTFVPGVLSMIHV